MGYAHTIILMYGIEVTSSEAISLCDYQDSDGDDEKDEGIWPGMNYDKEDVEIKEDIPLRYFVEILADGADSRIHDLRFDEDLDCFFIGIRIAARGYGSDDPIEDYIENLDKTRMNSLFDKYTKKVMDLTGINVGDRKPSIKLVSQVW